MRPERATEGTSQGLGRLRSRVGQLALNLTTTTTQGLGLVVYLKVLKKVTKYLKNVY